MQERREICKYVLRRESAASLGIGSECICWCTLGGLSQHTGGHEPGLTSVHYLLQLVSWISIICCNWHSSQV
jgi:hypothetical protein